MLLCCHNLYCNKPLKTLLEEKYLTEFPLKTTKGEPRLLLVTVDVQEGATVTFDSYGKLKKNDDGSIVKDEHGNPVYELKAEYGEYNNETQKYEHVIEYPKGITIDHVLASASVPISMTI